MQRVLFYSLDERGLASRLIFFVLACLLCLTFILTSHSVASHAAGVDGSIKSGVSGYCLDDHSNSQTPYAPVDSWSCNGTAAQAWIVGVGTIQERSGHSCLAVKNSAVLVDSPVVLAPCGQAAGQVWLRDRSGFMNPHSGLCLSLPNGQTGKQLVVASCSYLMQPYEIWNTNQTPNCALQPTEGEKIACNAEKQWTRWQAVGSNHESLLTAYTGGAPYEQWCADFVSYIYKAAGYPFTNGNYNGWDESIAPDIQYQGLMMHQASSYIPKPGDVAYFDYQGGHVEIVVSGGKTPTFIYGDSATIDPTTGNGDMEANTISSMGNEGHVVYYMSPT